MRRKEDVADNVTIGIAPLSTQPQKVSSSESWVDIQVSKSGRHWEASYQQENDI